MLLTTQLLAQLKRLAVLSEFDKPRMHVVLCLQDGDYATAARLAFQLRHPGRLLDVLRRQPGGPAAAMAALQRLVGQLEEQDLATALSYCR